MKCSDFPCNFCIDHSCDSPDYDCERLQEHHDLEKMRRMTMDVKCEITNYANDKIVDGPKIVVSSVFSEGDMAMIKYKNTELKVGIDELISALNKCRLNCFGR